LIHKTVFENYAGDVFIDLHNLTKKAGLWISDKKASMYVPCASCYFYSDQEQTVPSKIGGRVKLYPVFKDLSSHDKSNLHICEKCLANEDDEFLEFVIDWYENKDKEKKI